jgi:hypothetical protein
LHPVPRSGFTVGFIKTESNWAPESCTLPTAEQPLRIAEFTDLFAASLQGVDRNSPTRLRLALSASAREEAVRLAGAESSCCSFFTFKISGPVAGQVRVDIEVPDAHIAVLDTLADQAAGAGRLS